MKKTNFLKGIYVKPNDSLHAILKSQIGDLSNGIPAGIALVIDNENKLIGTITDGDLRRGIIKYKDKKVIAKNIMNSNPVTFKDGKSFSEVITELPRKLSSRARKEKTFLGKIIFVDHKHTPVKVLDYHQLWEQSVATHRHIAIIGMGYVGLTLGLKLSEIGFQVTGVDKSKKIVMDLNKGVSHVYEPGIDNLLKEQLSNNLRVTTKIPKNADVYIIAVGTPVKKYNNENKPDLKILINSTKDVGQNLTSGNLVILRSTIPISTTRNSILPNLEKLSGLTGGSDFHLSFAPERTIEGKALEELRTLPQIIGGLNSDSVEATVAVFRELTPIIIRVDSLEAAELIKLINNSFRDYTFAFSNQLAMEIKKFNIDIVDCINAANSGYPRDKIPLPSPGVGGPCLTKDPYILDTVSEESKKESTLWKHGRKVNEKMHNHVYLSIMEQIKKVDKDSIDCNILVCGLAFKGEPETADIRNSSSIEIIEFFRNSVNSIQCHDPIVSINQINELGLKSVEAIDAFKNMDVALFLNNNKFYNNLNYFEMVRDMNENPIIFDGWHIFESKEILNIRPCVYMGLSSVKDSLIK